MRRWSYIVLAPLTLACASVLGLEEARLEEDDGDVDRGGRTSQGGSGNDGNRAGTMARAGSSQGGTGAVSCDYGEDEPGECFLSCANGPCCQQSIDCFENAECNGYLSCLGDCGDDSECAADCAMNYSMGVGRATVLSLCILDCCPSGSGGSGGGGSGGSTGTSCRVEDPPVCTSATSVRYCNGGTPRTVACRTRCEEVGFEPGDGACVNDSCACGDAVDYECAVGAWTYCECAYEIYGETCTDVMLAGLYSGCYQGFERAEEIALCAASYAEEAPVDCESVLYYCTPATQ